MPDDIVFIILVKGLYRFNIQVFHIFMIDASIIIITIAYRTIVNFAIVIFVIVIFYTVDIIINVTDFIVEIV